MSREYLIRHDNGTYYRGMTPIGPAFGAKTAEEAVRFKDRIAAATEFIRHWAFGECAVVPAPRRRKP